MEGACRGNLLSDAEATRVGMGAELQAPAIGRNLATSAKAGLPAETFLSLNERGRIGEGDVTPP